MKKLIYSVVLISVVLLTLSSCMDVFRGTDDTDADSDKSNPPVSDNGNNDDTKEPADTPTDGEIKDDTTVTEPEGDYIWEKDTAIYVISSAKESSDAEYSSVYGTVLTKLYTSLGLVNGAVKLAPDSRAAYPHEIVLGRADRDISRRAYELLENVGLLKDEVGYLIYSDGYSVAIAYTNAQENVAINSALDYFESELASESLKLSEGVIKKEKYSMTTIWQERDDLAVAEAWKNLEERIFLELKKNGAVTDPEGYSKEMIAALKEVYSMYTDSLVLWFANLYEPYICICDGECQKTRYCGGAGFYYSNSARDNDYTVRDGVSYKLLPDAETTAQVFGFLHNSGILRWVGDDIFKAFPEGETDRIVRFIKALQDEKTGYFYHPQWLSMLGTAAFWDSRQSRDLTYSLSVLSSLGVKPTYKNPSGVPYDGILYDGTDLNAEARLTCPLGTSAVMAVSRVVAVSSVNPKLESEESFKNYLATLNIAGNSYYVGNELSSMAPQIVARDKEIGTAENPRPLATILDKWLRDNQDPETGHWHKYSTDNVYYATNGLLKIAALYNTLKLPFPNPLPAARSAFAVITSEEPINHVCDLYNTWFIISCVTSNLRNYSDNPDLASAIIDEVRVEAIPAVRVTAEKMKTHQKADGSFSYFKDKSSQNSQNAPVAIPNTNEGDVNATVIFTYGIVGYMFDALGFGSTVPMYTDSDRMVFLDIITERIENCEYRN